MKKHTLGFMSNSKELIYWIINKKVIIKNIFVGLVCLLCLLSFSDQALAKSGIGEGSTELGFSGNTSFTDMEGRENSTTMFTGLVTTGYFITDWLQLGGSVRDQYTKTDKEDYLRTTNLVGADAFAKLHYYEKGQIVIPYVGVQTGLILLYDVSETKRTDSSDDSTTSFVYGGVGGTKIFVTESASFNLEYNYRRYQMEIAGADININSHSILFGISYYF